MSTYQFIKPTTIKPNPRIRAIEKRFYHLAEMAHCRWLRIQERHDAMPPKPGDILFRRGDTHAVRLIAIHGPLYAVQALSNFGGDVGSPFTDIASGYRKTRTARPLF